MSRKVNTPSFRMCLAGVPLRRRGGSTRFACGLCLYPRARGHGLYIVYSDAGPPVYIAHGYAEARRWVTINYLRTAFGRAPGAREFLGRFRETFDWGGLAVWADHLDEQGKEVVARRLRALLPRQVLST